MGQLLYLVHKPTVKVKQEGTHLAKMVSYVKKLHRNEVQNMKVLYSFHCSLDVESKGCFARYFHQIFFSQLSRRKDGMFKVTQCFAQTSSFVNSLSAIIESPGPISFMFPLETVISLSETKP